jgi:hypothetical protein
MLGCEIYPQQDTWPWEEELRPPLWVVVQCLAETLEVALEQLVEALGCGMGLARAD